MQPAQPAPSSFPVAQVTSTTSSQLPSCLAIDPITDDTFGDGAACSLASHVDYDDKRVLAMNPDDAPSIQPITLPLPIVSEPVSAQPSENAPQPLPSLMTTSLRQEGLRSADVPSVEPVPAAAVVPSIVSKPDNGAALPSVPTNIPYIESTLTRQDMEDLQDLDIEISSVS